MKRIFPLFLLLFSVTSWSQSQTVLKGKIMANYTDLDGVHVINKNTEKAVVTENGGYFAIHAQPNDTLIISAVQFKGKKIKLEEKDFKETVFYIKLEVMVRQLSEVVINPYGKITSESLGLVPRGQKKYTPAERKLKTASGVDAQLGLSSSASLDPLLNWFSGRTSMLKKELEVEKKEVFRSRLEGMYEEDYFVNTLKIPEEYVQGFIFYAVENERFTAAIKAKNKTLATFLLNELAVQYKKIITDEK
ncbi:carboxypeptidase-like regulatory domain-containing protein [Flavobacterium inviolabile]|uniref:carboxypeptidase-like regulatory domain-containing protein n=1 Tax=Flavobacterium inviolabile TaxID=2748320 RepID=UPI0015B04FEB|nr:carboxypeptidase-like regulatory domain-containing protein [Flavobacterium inviolabile]